jgi:hypothetical protein
VVGGTAIEAFVVHLFDIVELSILLQAASHASREKGSQQNKCAGENKVNVKKGLN